MDKAYPKPFDRITVNPDKLGGEPCIRGLRISVVQVMNILASYPDRKQLFEQYPDLEEEDLKQALDFAATNLKQHPLELEVA